MQEVICPSFAREPYRERIARPQRAVLALLIPPGDQPMQCGPACFGPGRKMEDKRSSIAEVFLEADILEGCYQMLEALHSARR